MLSGREKKKLKTLTLEAKYLKAQLDLNTDTLEEAQEKFAKAYNDVCKTVPEHERVILQGAMQKEKEKGSKKEPNLSKAGQKAKERRKPKKEIKEILKNPQSKSMKKIYRAIARESHPDKLLNATEEEIKTKEELFKAAQTASEEVNLVDLIEIAEDLNIMPPELEKEHIEILEKNIKNIKKGIKMMKDTTAWQWHHMQNLDEKEAILIGYMQYIYMNFK